VGKRHDGDTGFMKESIELNILSTPHSASTRTKCPKLVQISRMHTNERKKEKKKKETP
jgi:hypothetical protein